MRRLIRPPALWAAALAVLAAACSGGGGLCFYFGADEPTDYSPITEIASECRED